MKRTGAFLFLCVCAMSVFAQDYPCRKLIEQGDYEKAKAKIEKQLEKTPDSFEFVYACHKLCIESQSPTYDLQTAYLCITKSIGLFGDLESKTVSKLAKKGFSTGLLESDLRTVCRLFLHDAEAQNTVEAFCSFLDFCKDAPEDFVASAVRQRNVLAFQDAVEQNTSAAYNHFLQSYPDAVQVPEVVRLRNAAAYAEAQNVHTIEAYRLFLSLYPEAEQVAEAARAITALAFEQAAQENTEEAYRRFQQEYPDSPEAAEALARADRLQYETFTQAGTADVYIAYMQQFPDKAATVALAQDALMNNAIKGKNKDAMAACLPWLGAERKLVLLQNLHNLMADESLDSLKVYYTRYDPENLVGFWQKDSIVTAVYGQLAAGRATKEEFVRKAAPYRLAYRFLLGMIQPLVVQNDYAAALATAQGYAVEFGKDTLYTSLLTALENKAAVDFTLAIADARPAQGRENAPTLAAQEMEPLQPKNDLVEKLLAHEDSLYRYPAEADIDTMIPLGQLYVAPLEAVAQCWICRSKGKTGVVDDQKRVCVPFAYDTITRVYNGNHPTDSYFTRKDGKVGLLSQLAVVYPPVMRTISLSPFKVVEQDGTEKTFRTYDEFRKYGMFVTARERNSLNFKPDDSQLKTLALDAFNTEYAYADGMLAVQDFNTALWGFVNDKGELQIPQKLQTTGTPHFSNGYCLIFNNSKVQIIDKEGNVQASLPDNYLYFSDFNQDGVAFAVVKIPGNNTSCRYALIDAKGKEVHSALYSGKRYQIRYGAAYPQAFPLHGGAAFFYDGDPNATGEQYGLYDVGGKVIKKAAYARVHDFSEGLAAVQQPAQGTQPAKWGFINTKGEWAIPAQYSNEPDDFHDGYALVKKSNGNWVYIDKKGEVVSPEYVGATAFYQGHAFVKTADNWQKQVINRHFTVIGYSYPLDIAYQQIISMPFRNGLLAYSNYGMYALDGGENGIWDAKGNCLDFDVPFSFKVKRYADDLMHVEYKPAGGTETLDAFMDYTGKLVFVLRRNEF